jgi:hypothetical protein
LLEDLLFAHAQVLISPRDTPIQSADRTLRQPHKLTRHALKILSHLHNHLTQFQLLKPASRNSHSTILRTQQVPGDEPGTVTIAAVIHRSDHALFKRGGCQGAPQPDSQRFFGDPSANEFAYSLWSGLVALLKEKENALNAGLSFFHTGNLTVLGQTLSNRMLQAVLPIDKALENIGKQPGGQVASRICVGQAP